MKTYFKRVRELKFSKHCIITVNYCTGFLNIKTDENVQSNNSTLLSENKNMLGNVCIA
jgi:hypothetical protein